MYEYRAEVLRVVDGDTVDLRVDLGFKVRFDIRARLYGIDAPETYGVKKNSEEWKAGMRAKEALQTLIEGRQVVVVTHKDKQGKYGRWLVDIFVDEVDYVNDYLAEQGYAEWVDYE